MSTILESIKIKVEVDTTEVDNAIEKIKEFKNLLNVVQQEYESLNKLGTKINKEALSKFEANESLLGGGEEVVYT